MSKGAASAGAVPLEAVRDADGPAVGAKAVNLARMMRAGLPVPPGFCVTGGSYRERLDSGGLAARAAALLPELAAAPPERRRELLSEFREAVVGAPMSEGLAREIEGGYRALGAGRVAVRSSATAEDLPERSFAGQHDTYLNVADLSGCLRAVRECWASLWTERAYEYRERSGIDHLAADMAVIVQEFIPADAAGVLFTADPVTGRRDRVVIEASFGLGEALVSGKVSPDRVVLSKKGLRVIERTTSTKTVETVPDETGGVRERVIEPRRASATCVDDAAARRLAKLALRAEKAFGAAQDIEWAVSEGRPYILQSRAVTAVPPVRSWEDRQVWTNVNAAEVMPDVMTPMTCSVMEGVVERLVGSFLDKLGVSLEGHPLAGVVAGRAYFNLNTVIACVRRIPGMGDESIAEFFGGRQDAAAALGEIEIPEEDVPDVAASALAAVSRLPGYAFEFLSFSPSKGHRVLSQMREKTDALEGTDLRSLSEKELAGLIGSAFADLLGSREMWELSGVVQTYETVLYDACRGWFGESGNAFASRLLSGLGNNENALAGLDLWRLAALAHDHPAVEEALLSVSRFDEFRREAEEVRGGEKFLAPWDAFLRDHGHHCRGEIELMNPRWSEEPEHILEQVRSYLRAVGGDDFFARYTRLSRERASTLEECRRRLWNPIKRLAFDFLLHQAQRCAPIRESLKSRVVRWLAAVRGLLLELGRRLTSRGTLADRDDVFFLRVEEIEPVSRGEAVADVGGMIAERRAEYERNLTIKPPPVVVGRFDPDAVVPEAIDENARTLTGVAANPGVVTGPARVILQAGTGRVEPGEILVAPFTDPGWTPYFLNAAAIVMDTGGILSHGSIIAREYGIPAVVNVGPATKIIRTGQVIRVDGGRGVVRIFREGSAPWPEDDSADDRQVWTNANTGEVLPDVMTPMAWSVARRLVTELFNGVLGRLGIEFGENPLVDLIAGRLYFNLNTFLGAMRGFPVLRKRDLSELFGGRQGALAALGRLRISREDIPDLNASWLRTAFKLPGFVRWFVSHPPGEGRRFVAGMRRRTDGFWRADWRSLSDRALARHVRSVALDLLDAPHGVGFAAVGLMYSMTLFNVCRRWFGEEGDAIASRLLAGLGGMDNADAGLELWRLALFAHGHPAVGEAVLSGRSFGLLGEELHRVEGGGEFLARWAGFMRRYGHHARGELEVGNARWSEDPDHVLGLLRGYLRSVGETDPLARYGRLREERGRLAERCRRRLWNPLRRLAFEFVLRQAQRGTPIRENVKSEVVRRVALGRRMLLELGERLARRGVLREREDVFFLHLEEAEPVCAGEADFDVSETVSARRAEYERNLSISPPSVVVGRFDADDFVPDEVDENAEVLTGVAVCAGVVTGPARVITQAGTDQVLPGEILVAPFTDPGWTPYFLNAAGVVMDAGGVLSHGSIIAREYGIPCVVNVGPATKIIETGRTVRVDGNRGEVRLLERAAHGAAREGADEDRGH